MDQQWFKKPKEIVSKLGKLIKIIQLEKQKQEVESALRYCGVRKVSLL